MPKFYNDGVITIPNVTGNLEITVTAVKSALSYINQIPLSTDSNGAIYNGGLGYKNGFRLNSSGEEKGNASSFVTGFIPVKAGDVIRFSGAYIAGTAAILNNYMYKANRTQVTGSTTINGVSISCNPLTPYSFFASPKKETVRVLYGPVEIDETNQRVLSMTIPNTGEIAYARFTLNAADGANAIITINEEIT